MSIYQRFAFFSAFAGLLSLISSCAKTDDGLQINVPATVTVNFSIPTVGAGDSIVREMTLTNVPAQLDSVIKSQHPALGVGDVQSCTVSACKLTLTNGSVQTVNNLSAFSSIGVQLTVSPLPYVSIGQKSIADNPSQVLEIPPVTVELKELLTRVSSVNIRVTGRSRRATTEPLYGKFSFTYLLKVSK